MVVAAVESDVAKGQRMGRYLSTAILPTDVLAAATPAAAAASASAAAAAAAGSSRKEKGQRRSHKGSWP